MSNGSAFLHAIQIQSVPSQIPFVRSQPLAADVHRLLQYVTSDCEGDPAEFGLINRPPRDLRSAAEHYIAQILLFDEADAYRRLGVNADASADAIRANMTLLMRWAHPDNIHREDRQAYAQKVSDAWNALKTAERRQAYDNVQRLNSKPRSKSAGRPRAAVVPIKQPIKQRAAKPSFLRKWLRRTMVIGFSAIVLSFFVQPSLMMAYAESQLGNLTALIARYVSK